jgi:hypothetical protein
LEASGLRKKFSPKKIISVFMAQLLIENDDEDDDQKKAWIII